ncbi:peptidase S9 prolyl oligopeptidase active site domain protein [Catenulispora acidiphila DSM 44928]|uniref:Peptidase S9 prolyl oligopeptidase active site domain protein n=1 Tax=Catenulispora acidiphila (strain DSM 44928 / JCM 14897 / NBRC 102108 / NRRL B-24433 / ID139908) TaxID=479433 RepID=C7Q1Q1_CATAD|nr:prolyl oligopeptidase family serine peptidase [Catenulispora acidiphila]ACU75602.1 peptidase S9 prolyl oligopeptidase active site domain protein [Catenulispora acidiphila DSM 44928]
MTKVDKPYGSWPSPITPEDVAAAPGAPQWPSVVGEQTWWCAPDPATATVGLMRRGADGEVGSVLGADWPVGNKAIGYGGRPYLATPDLAVFSCSRDQRLYRLADVPVPLTPADPDGVRCSNYSDMILGPTGTEIWAIREVYEIPQTNRLTDPAPRTTREIVAIPLSGAAAEDPDALRIVARSHHFLSTIRLSPDGTRLSWLGWNHPVMPWETTDLMVASILDGVAVAPVRVLGGDEGSGGVDSQGSIDTQVSVAQAEWADADTLYALADPDGWWNLFRVDLAGEETTATNVFPTQTECGHAIWRVGSTSFAVTDAGVVLRRSLGDETLILWDPETGETTDLAPGWTEFASSVSGSAGSIAVVAASATEPSTPLRIDVARRDTVRCVERAEYPHEAWVGVPERRHVQVEGGWQVPYIYHPPTNPGYRGPSDTPPPLLIDVHGGPTSSTVATRHLAFALFTSRGYAVASVDYGGSTGYGRAYRDRLRHTWGVTDVEDSVAVARALADAGLADPRRTGIRGGSAGGWATLAALAHSDYFACGTVYFPISDPGTWFDEQTHDFESRYVHYLIGDPDKDAERFAKVSPLAHAAEITAPFIMLQGLDDVICRPDQADRLVWAVERVNPGLVRAYHRFPGEGHGFRKDETMSVCLQAELDLYADVLGAGK